MSRQVPEELLDLLVSDVTEGLDAEARARLDAAAGQHAGLDRDEWERVAALTHLALLDSTPTAQERMPADVRHRLLGNLSGRSGVAHSPASGGGSIDNSTVVPLGGRTATTSRGGDDQSTMANLGWYLAAGVAAAWVGTQWLADSARVPGLEQPSGPAIVVQAPSAAEQRDALLAAGGDVVTVPWSQTTEDFSEVRGDVVWSTERQEGYMRLAAMPANDARVAQYQLWIVDPERDQEPVDGGVFDVVGTGEVIVPIAAKLQVVAPAAFAITREKPGGVVVSEGPLLVVASL
jgi:hypothetical protein